MTLKSGMKRILAAVICLAAVASCALGEVTLVETVKSGKVTEAVWTDSSGEPAAGPEGYTIIRYSVKKQGTEEMYFSADDEPYRMPGGYYGRLLTYDNKKRVTSIIYLDENGERTMIDAGYSRVRTDYTSFGAEKIACYYDDENHPVNVPSLGYASVETDFRGKTMTKRTYYDENGKETDCALGYAVITQKVNKKNQITSITYTHADGSPATCEDGWSRCEKELDKDGREVLTKYYTESGELTDRGRGYAWEENDYSNKNEIRVTKYDAAGKKTETYGYATVVRKIKDDLTVRESYLSADGSPAANSDGIGAINYGYDSEGRLYQVTYEDVSGSPAAGPAGAYGYRDSFDEDGAVISRTFLGADGNPGDAADGCREIRYIYDGSKQLTETRKYNAEGIQIK